MNRKTGRTWPPTARAAVAVFVTAALALLVAACSSGPSSTGSGGSSGAGGPANSTSANSTSAVAYAGCMRSRGVPNYPDPSSGNTMPNGLPKVSPERLGVTMSQFQAAEAACRHLLPNGGETTRSASQQLLSDGLKFARCMRSHGVPNWPDPARSTASALALGAPPYMFHMGGIQGLDGRSFPPRVTTVMHDCLRLTHLTGSQVPGWSG